MKLLNNFVDFHQWIDIWSIHTQFIQRIFPIQSDVQIIKQPVMETKLNSKVSTTQPYIICAPWMDQKWIRWYTISFAVNCCWPSFLRRLIKYLCTINDGVFEITSDTKRCQHCFVIIAAAWKVIFVVIILAINRSNIQRKCQVDNLVLFLFISGDWVAMMSRERYYYRNFYYYQHHNQFDHN